MKRAFLVVYDYGQGGVWAYIKARFEAEIRKRFPELRVVDPRPAWMTPDVVARIKAKMTFDIDRPDGWLSELAKDPKRRRIAAG